MCAPAELGESDKSCWELAAAPRVAVWVPAQRHTVALQEGMTGRGCRGLLGKQHADVHHGFYLCRRGLVASKIVCALCAAGFCVKASQRWLPSLAPWRACSRSISTDSAGLVAPMKRSPLCRGRPYAPLPLRRTSRLHLCMAKGDKASNMGHHTITLSASRQTRRCGAAAQGPNRLQGGSAG